eukprot:CAMPEP_0198229288 /NCGR_PEP_ID=MMETSP1445-20131203/114042_1 /TAXON_ID=36898 /ORGANISM="Pyramimonas sp., Strain CCMP2087" /LENGTH=319 /DNA_ID=CAMNT_0043909739 /DNA_START=547 /DNA_END=1506 /DNA_ORIENTATION=-
MAQGNQGVDEVKEYLRVTTGTVLRLRLVPWCKDNELRGREKYDPLLLVAEVVRECRREEHPLSDSTFEKVDWLNVRKKVCTARTNDSELQSESDSLKLLFSKDKVLVKIAKGVLAASVALQGIAKATEAAIRESERKGNTPGEATRGEATEGEATGGEATDEWLDPPDDEGAHKGDGKRKGLENLSKGWKCPDCTQRKRDTSGETESACEVRVRGPQLRVCDHTYINEDGTNVPCGFVKLKREGRSSSASKRPRKDNIEFPSRRIMQKRLVDLTTQVQSLCKKAGGVGGIILLEGCWEHSHNGAAEKRALPFFTVDSVY